MIIDITRNGSYVRAIDDLIKLKDYVIDESFTSLREAQEYYFEDDIIYKYIFTDLPALVVRKDDKYEVLVNYGRVKNENIGYINYSPSLEEIINNDYRAVVMISGGIGKQLLYNDKTDRLKFGKETFYDYTFKLSINKIEQ